MGNGRGRRLAGNVFYDATDELDGPLMGDGVRGFGEEEFNLDTGGSGSGIFDPIAGGGEPSFGRNADIDAGGGTICNLVGYGTARDGAEIKGGVTMVGVATGLDFEVGAKECHEIGDLVDGACAFPGPGGVCGLAASGDFEPDDALGAHFEGPAGAGVGEVGGPTAVAFVYKMAHAVHAANFFIGGDHEAKIGGGEGSSHLLQ